MTSRYVTAPLPELPTAPYQRRDWVAAVPVPALLHPTCPVPTPGGDAECPCCGGRVHRVSMMGALLPASRACRICHQALDWTNWDARLKEYEAESDVEDEDEVEEEPCRCCGEWCDPDEDDGLCDACADQGCMRGGHR